MSRSLANQQQNPRDYGATSSSNTNVITSAPDVNFSGFSPTEFMSLSEAIANNINSVKSSWTQLEKMLKQLENRRDTQGNRDKIYQIQTLTNIKIEQTSKDLKRLIAVAKRGDKPQKLQLERLTSDFRTVVQNYSNSEQQIVRKMKQLLLQAAVAQQQDEESAASNADMSESDKQELLRKQEENQRALQFEQDMMKERAAKVQEIETHVLDVNKIMQDLSVLVNQQGEQIDTIEGSIDHSAADVEGGLAELRKAAEYRQRYRRKILILLIIAVIIGLIVTGIIVSKLKS